jgi:hypothetical protein
MRLSKGKSLLLFFILYLVINLSSGVASQSVEKHHLILKSFAQSFSAKDSKKLSELFHTQYFWVDHQGEVIVANEETPQPPLFQSLGFEEMSWKRAALESTSVVQRSKEKVHVITNIVLFDESNARVGTHQAIFIINEIEEKWRIYGISFLKPVSDDELLKELDLESEKEVMQVWDDFGMTFNARDPERHSDTHHFPHFRLASKEFNLDSRDSYMVNKIPFFFFLVKVSTGFKWHHSKWSNVKIVQATENKVHVTTEVTRHKSDDSIFATFDSLYVLIKKNGKWGVLGRSSFAPL